jgi:hypothetical protein
VVQEKFEFQVADINQREGHQPGENDDRYILKVEFDFFCGDFGSLFIGVVYSFLHVLYFLIRARKPKQEPKTSGKRLPILSN